MSPLITANAFWRAFRKAWDSSPLKNNDATFIDNERMLASHGGLLRRVMDELTALTGEPMQYQKEFFRVDAAFLSGPCFHDHFRKQSEIYVPDNDFCEKGWDGYPIATRVLIDHETKNWPTKELWNLLHLRAELKVIITYPYAHPEKAREMNDYLDGAVCPMLDLTQQSQPEYRDAEYIFLIGQFVRTTRRIEWQAEVISHLGSYRRRALRKEE